MKRITTTLTYDQIRHLENLLWDDQKNSRDFENTEAWEGMQSAYAFSKRLSELLAKAKS